MQIHSAPLYAVGIEQIHPLFDAGNTVGNLGEGVFAEKLLLDVERTMIGGDGIDQSGFERVPENILIALFAQGRRHDA